MREKIIAWIKISRLHFYPMTWIAYSLGAMAASRSLEKWDLRAYWVGYLVLFFIELSTILYEATPTAHPTSPNEFNEMEFIDAAKATEYRSLIISSGFSEEISIQMDKNAQFISGTRRIAKGPDHPVESFLEKMLALW